MHDSNLKGADGVAPRIPSLRGPGRGEAKGSGSGRRSPAASGATSEGTSGATSGATSEKGLGSGSLGLLGSTVIGLSSVAPVYALTSTLGPTAGEVGVHLPAIFLAGFLPMLLPARFASVHPRLKTPVFATVAQGVATAVFYAVMTFLSENVLVDAIYALGLMICFYYALTSFACAWYFRREALRSVRDFTVKSAIPVVGGVMLSAVFLKTLYDIWDPAYGSGSQILGVGSVFLIGVGLLVLGVFVMLAQQIHRPAFFRGQTLDAGTAVRTEEDLVDA